MNITAAHTKYRLTLVIRWISPSRESPFDLDTDPTDLIDLNNMNCITILANEIATKITSFMKVGISRLFTVSWILINEISTTIRSTRTTRRTTFLFRIGGDLEGIGEVKFVFGCKQLS
jgi:hypothetical protein